ncbi:exonuclease domain-containing protein [Ignavigranum ruoffiae]|uniref:exonuclease domain-containing protein n=1 Tax=Ignavigranum ruoffiae TaxID=89093 RepID=UPI0024AE7139|nr:exonuclease domain-containing protein [Ignavigranum ruoffiae]
MQNKAKIAVIDIETTGPNYQKDDKIIQIAAIIYSEGQIINEYNMLINPERNIPEHIQRLTGIQQGETDKAPSFEQVANLWFHRLLDCIFVAHNLNFDYKFLEHNFKQSGFVFKPIAIDSVILAKILCYDAVGFNLTDLSHYFALPFQGAHDALADARITCQILARMAKIVQAIDTELIRKIADLVAELPYQTQRFFQEPELFDMPIAKTEISVQKNSKPSNLNSATDYLLPILEAYQDHPHLLVEDDQMPMSPSTVFHLADYLIRQGNKVLIALSHSGQIDYLREWLDQADPQLVYQQLSPQAQFIDRNMIETLLARKSQLALNQHELTVLAASIHWLSHSTEGHYREINQELHADQLIDKYRSDFGSGAAHLFYERMKSQAQQAQVLLIDHAYLIQLLQQPHSFLSHLVNSQWHLLLDNLGHYIQTKRWQERVCLDISRIFDVVNRFIDQGRLRGAEFDQTKRLQEFLRTSNQLMDWLDLQFKDHQPEPSPKQINLSLYLDPRQAIWPEFVNLIQSWLDQAKTCSHFIEDYLGKSPADKAILALFQQIKRFNLLRPLTYIELRAHQFHSYYFHFEMNQFPLVFSNSGIIEPYCFGHSILISMGGYLNQRAPLLKKVIPLGQHYMLNIHGPGRKQKFIGQVPLDYCSAKANSADQYQLLVDYLEDHLDQLKAKLIILAENKEASASILNYLLKNQAVYQAYRLFSESLSGSIHKIYRRFLESTQGILVLSFDQLQTLHNEYQPAEIDLFVLRLPFLSPKHTYILAMDYLMAEEDQHLFEQIVYPQMVQDFKEMLTYMEEFYIFNKVTIFDQRIFTKGYANRLRQDLNALIHFELL